MSDFELLKILGIRLLGILLRYLFVFTLIFLKGISRLINISSVRFMARMNLRPSIYEAGRARTGQTHLAFSTKKLYLYKTLRYTGAFMVCFSVTALLYSYAPLASSSYFKVWAQEKIMIDDLENVDGPMFLPKHEVVEKEDLAGIETEAKSFGVDTNFSIVIPKIEAYSNVVDNVDPNEKEEYLAAMLEGVAHSSNTSYPGQSGVTYLFAHSTNSPLYIEQYNAVFYRLRELTEGDSVIVYYDGKRYEYRVKMTEVVSIDDTRWVNSTDPEPRLVLQTSHPPGTIWRRLLVICEPVIF